MYYDSDPVNYFTVLSTDNDKGFALSYDVEKVTDYSSELATDTLSAAIDDALSTCAVQNLQGRVCVQSN